MKDDVYSELIVEFEPIVINAGSECPHSLFIFIGSILSNVKTVLPGVPNNLKLGPFLTLKLPRVLPQLISPGGKSNVPPFIII